MIVPSMTSTRYDLLDTLRDGASWSTPEIAEDTGRSRSSIQSVTRTLDADGLVVWSRKRGQRVSDIRITEAGLRWLWCVEQRLPGQAVDLVALILVAVEDGPMLTSQLSGLHQSGHRLREVVLHLRKAGAVEVKHRRQMNGARLRRASPSPTTACT